jgi:hypothetical protein
LRNNYELLGGIMSDRDDVRGMVTALYAQADVEMRNGNTDTASRIDSIANEINLDTAPVDKVFDIFVSVNEGRFDDAVDIISDPSFPDADVGPGGASLNRTVLGLDPLPSPGDDDDDPPY